MKSAKMLQILFFAEVSQRNMLLTAVPEVMSRRETQGRTTILKTLELMIWEIIWAFTARTED